MRTAGPVSSRDTTQAALTQSRARSHGSHSMANTLLENGREVGSAARFERHPGADLEGGRRESDSCTFELPYSASLALGKSSAHALRYDNGSTVPVRITRVTGGTTGVHVTAVLP